MQAAGITPTEPAPTTERTGGTEEAPSSAPTVEADLTADDLVAELSEVDPPPDPRDTTDGCRDGGEQACTARITTEFVTVYELPDEKVAALWADEMGSVGDARQAGRFMLLWHEGSPHSEAARDELNDRALDLAG